MRNIKAFALLALAVVFGLAAAVYAARWIAQRGSVPVTRVVVAAVDIELGSRINPQMLSTVEWPTGSMPDGAFGDPSQLQDRVLKVGLQRGDAVLERKLSPAGTTGGLSAVIAEGKRAMTVRVNDVVGVGGFALPGNYVDVMVNTQMDRGNVQSPISLTVLEHVLVLAVAQEAGRDDTKPKVVNAVTLELSPQDTEKLDLARSVGTLSLVLRNQLDKDSVATKGITRDQLLNVKQALAPVAPQSVKVIRVAAPRAPAPEPHRDCVEVIGNATSIKQCF